MTPKISVVGLAFGELVLLGALVVGETVVGESVVGDALVGSSVGTDDGTSVLVIVMGAAVGDDEGSAVARMAVPNGRRYPQCVQAQSSWRANNSAWVATLQLPTLLCSTSATHCRNALGLVQASAPQGAQTNPANKKCGGCPPSPSPRVSSTLLSASASEVQRRGSVWTHALYCPSMEAWQVVVLKCATSGTTQGRVGAAVGLPVGTAEVGASVGASVVGAEVEGSAVGSEVLGAADGTGVGAEVGANWH
jgi:hypothetical protein